MDFKWSWCEVCEIATPICPRCGNNLCNGHYECVICKEIGAVWDILLDKGEVPETEKEVEIYNKTENL